MVELLFAIGALCCFIAVFAAAARQAGVLDQARQSAELAQGATRRSIRTFPAKLVSTIDRAQTWLRADRRPSRRPASGSNVSWRRTAGRSRSIAAPKIDGAYDVLPIRSGEDPARYIANAISHAGPHKTIVFPKSGIYNFSSAGCQTGGAHLKLNAATDVVMLARKRSAWISRGVDDRPVRANRVRKSVGAENTFSSDLTEFDAMVAVLRPLIDKVWRHCEGTGNRGRTITLKVKFSDFEIITRSRSVPTAVSSHSDLERLSVGLLRNEMPLPKPVRLLGVSLSSLQAEVLAEPPTPPADLTRR
jgi:hypothetical protein